LARPWASACQRHPEMPHVNTEKEVEEQKKDLQEEPSSPASASPSRVSGVSNLRGTSFIVAEEEEEEDKAVGGGEVRTRVGKVLSSNGFEFFVASVTILNFILICMDTDAQAIDAEAPTWVDPMMHACFVIFCCELALRVFVERRRTLRSPWNVLDSVIVFTGSLDYLLVWVGADLGQLKLMSTIRLVRLCRLLRLLRVVWRFSMFRELRKVVQMMGSCFKTLFWSFILMGIVMTAWAVIAVELINPRLRELAEDGVWDNCDRCQRAFSSVAHANLTFFQTIIAGDSWGMVAIPIIEAYWWSGVIFMGSLLTLIFGVLNLIVAVVVDTFAEVRSKDMLSRAQEMECDEVEEKKVLSRIFAKIDEDNSGAVSWEELQEGAKKVAEFRYWLRVLDIDAKDLYQLFQIVDIDGSGEIDPSEFIEAMYRMKNAESKTATRFVKHLVTRLHGELEEKCDSIESKVNQCEYAISRGFSDMMGKVVEKSEEAIRCRLSEQEEAVTRSIEEAMSKSAEMALDAALQAAAAAARQVISRVDGSSDKLAGLQRQIKNELRGNNGNRSFFHVGTPTASEIGRPPSDRSSLAATARSNGLLGPREVEAKAAGLQAKLEASRNEHRLRGPRPTIGPSTEPPSTLSPPRAPPPPQAP